MKNISTSVLRQSLITKRLALSATQRAAAAEGLSQQILDWLAQHSTDAMPQRIGLYSPIKGEIDTVPLMQALLAQQHLLYLPRIHPFCRNELLFLRYQPDSLLTNNHWNIPEPALDVTQVLPFHQLDILFVPLVGFDYHNNRVGMGGGFYDRMLQHYTLSKLLPIGVAYELQRVTKLTRSAWDVPLPIVITPEHIYVQP